MNASVERLQSELLGPLPPFRAVIMDMDGLALDTEATYCAAWQSAASSLGFELTHEFCRSLFGRHADDVKLELSKACGDRLDLAAFHILAERHWRESLQAAGVSKMPNLDRLLHLLQARGLPYALATNSDRPYALQCLRAAGALAQFPVLVTRDEVARGKPEPDIFLEAARRLGVPASECLALEDSRTGLAACLQAGMIPVWIPPRHAQGKTVAEARINVFPALGVLADYIEGLPV